MTTLTEILNDPEVHYPGNFDTPERANALLTGLCQDAAIEIDRLNKAVADEREACVRKTEEFARKWWKIHCDSNLHYSSTLKAHQDFCALQAAIKARKNT